MQFNLSNTPTKKNAVHKWKFPHDSAKRSKQWVSGTETNLNENRSLYLRIVSWMCILTPFIYLQTDKPICIKYCQWKLFWMDLIKLSFLLLLVYTFEECLGSIQCDNGRGCPDGYQCKLDGMRCCLGSNCTLESSWAHASSICNDSYSCLGNQLCSKNGCILQVILNNFLELISF